MSTAPGEPWGADTCVPLKGDGRVGDSCDREDSTYTGVDNCDPGLIWLLTDDAGKRRACIEFCAPGANCVIYNEGSLPICFHSCDALIQDCPEGQACHNCAGDDFVCSRASATVGEGTPGDERVYIHQSQEGSFCAAATALADCPTPGCCTPYCPVSGGNAPCNMGEDCVTFFAGAGRPGLEDVGVCAVPG